MKKVYHLSTCSTCQRILKEWSLDDSYVLQDIKTESITENQIIEMIELSGSAESLFSRRAMKYKSMGLGDKNLSETEISRLIVDEYTFLMRPVMINDDKIFVGNSKNVVAQAKASLDKT